MALQTIKQMILSDSHRGWLPSRTGLSCVVLIIFLTFHLSLFTSHAQTIRDVFKVMPDSLTPYLTANNRLDMMDFMDAKRKAIVTNQLDGDTEMLFLSDDSLAVRMSDALTMELGMEHVDTTTVLRMKQVYCVSNDREQMILTRYDTASWQVLTTETLSSTLQRRDEEINSKKPI